MCFWEGTGCGSAIRLCWAPGEPDMGRAVSEPVEGTLRRDGVLVRSGKETESDELMIAVILSKAVHIHCTVRMMIIENGNGKK